VPQYSHSRCSSEDGAAWFTGCGLVFLDIGYNLLKYMVNVLGAEQGTWKKSGTPLGYLYISINVMFCQGGVGV